METNLPPLSGRVYVNLLEGNFWLVNYDELLIGGFKHERMIFHVKKIGDVISTPLTFMNHHFFKIFFLFAPPTRLLLNHINNQLLTIY